MAKTKVTPFDRAQCQAYLASLLEQTTLEVSAVQLEQLTTLIEMLNTWNAALNLTAIKDVNQMVLLHVVDSAVVLPVLLAQLKQAAPEVESPSVVDVGTGAGFPGLVLAILAPQVHFTLIDSVGKKLSFVRQVVARLKLTNVELINKRCEDIEHEPFAVIVSRAFAPLERMVGWCLPLLAPSGRFVAMKANLEPGEIQAIPETVTIDQTVKLQVPTLEAMRQAVVLRRAS